jgi:hypothetical protein
MNKLLIKDLPRAEELDRDARHSIRGGSLVSPLLPNLSFLFDNSRTIASPQFIQQGMTINNISGNGGSNSTTQIIPMMTAGNNFVAN